jgi:hypothetical protein
MSLLIGLLEYVGAGQSLVIAAVLAVGAWYIFKGARLASLVGTLALSGVGYAVVFLVGLAAAVALGWFDPNVGTIMGHLGAIPVVGVVSGLVSWVFGAIVDLVTGVLPI